LELAASEFVLGDLQAKNFANKKYSNYDAKYDVDKKEEQDEQRI
jgi:hypothetical protein